jgi:hypothetical protein
MLVEPAYTSGCLALERRRIGHVGRTYLRATGYTAANPRLSPSRPVSVLRRCWVVGIRLCGRVLPWSRYDCHLVGGNRRLALLADQRGVQLAPALCVLRVPGRAS